MAGGSVRPYEMVSAGPRAVAKIGQKGIFTDTTDDCPVTVCVLERTSVDISPEAKPREDMKVVFNNLTICESEQSIVYSGTDSRNSDIGHVRFIG